MILSIIIPVYNEKDTILEILKRVEAVNLETIKKEIIIIDDFSTDGTRGILKKLENTKSYKITYHEENMGKGAAIRSGLKYALGDIVLIQDADLEYNPENYKELIKPIVDGKFNVVYGSRFLNQPFSSKQKWFLPTHYLGNKILSLMTSILYFKNITDMETCYKVFKKEVLDGITIESNGFNIEPEITAKLLKKGYKILEIPISYTSRGFEEGKKIRMKDGFVALYTLLKYKFSRK